MHLTLVQPSANAEICFRCCSTFRGELGPAHVQDYGFGLTKWLLAWLLQFKCSVRSCST